MSKVAFLFPGQGAQTVGMGQRLYESVPAARDLYDRANEALGYDLAKICFEGPAAKLDSTVRSQPALFVTSLAALEALRSTQPEVIESCQAAAGLSLGEYTALVFASVIDFETALPIVQLRGQAMQDASDARASGMVSVLGLSETALQDLCEESRSGNEVLGIANMLCPGNIVVSGDRIACERLCELAEDAGAMKTVPLSVAGAFHTSIMQPAVERLAGALENAPLSPPRIPLIANVDAKPHDDPELIRKNLVEQVVSPVLWEASMRRLLDDTFDHFWEVGPGRVLRALLKRINRKVSCEGVDV